MRKWNFDTPPEGRKTPTPSSKSTPGSKSTTNDLQSTWECSGPCYIHIQCQTTTIVAPTWWYTTTCSPGVLRVKSVGKRYLDSPDEGRKTPTPGSKSTTTMDLQSCWECSGPCYIHIQCQTTTLVAPTWWHTQPLEAMVWSSPKSVWSGKTNWLLWGRDTANIWLIVTANSILFGLIILLILFYWSTGVSILF